MKAVAVNLPLVSVVLTTYNRSALLPRAVRSVLHGTYDNFELIIVDDASTDNTPEVVSGFGDTRIQYVRLPENGGVLRARNRGFDLAKGSYITTLDDDDVLSSDALATVVEAFERSQHQGVNILWFECLDAEAGNSSGSINTDNGQIEFKDYLCGKIKGDFWLAFSSKALNGNRFREELRAHESLLWLKLHKRYRARHVPVVLCRKYRQHGGARLSTVDVMLTQLPETVHALRLYLKEFGDDMRQTCPDVYGFRLAYLGLHELMIGDRMSGRRSILKSLRYRFSFKFLALYGLSWLVGSRTVIAIYRRTEGV